MTDQERVQETINNITILGHHHKVDLVIDLALRGMLLRTFEAIRKEERQLCLEGSRSCPSVTSPPTS